MTLKQFQRLRRGDIIFGEAIDGGTTNRIWKVLGRAIYVVETGRFTIHLEHCLYADMECDLDETNFADFLFTPRLYVKYSFSPDD